MKIEELMNNKKILFVPVYSTRSYETGTYDLAADGNVSKIIMKLLNSTYKNVDILFPMNSVNLEEVKSILQDMQIKNVSWIPCKYGVNAHETRNAGEKFLKYIETLHSVKKQKYDLIISEIDTLAEIVASNNYEYCNKENFLYWAGSWNADGTRWDEKGHELLNKKIASVITTACLLKGQVSLYGGKSFYDICKYEPQYFEKKVIFFPFRLSDESYKLNIFKNAVKELVANGHKNFVVLYTDPNDSKLLDNLNDETAKYYVKVPKDKSVYLSILKGKPIIPFLDDLDKNYHSNIFEFTFYNCDVIMKKSNNYTFENVTILNDDCDLAKILESKIRSKK